MIIRVSDIRLQPQRKLFNATKIQKYPYKYYVFSIQLI